MPNPASLVDTFMNIGRKTMSATTDVRPASMKSAGSSFENVLSRMMAPRARVAAPSASAARHVQSGIPDAQAVLGKALTMNERWVVSGTIDNTAQAGAVASAFQGGAQTIHVPGVRSANGIIDGMSR